jgi:predicted aspartyl protease
LSIGEDVYTDDFMFHTGYGGSILLDPKIGEKYTMQSRLKTISTSELRDSYNNIIKIETKQLPQISIGGESLREVPVSFAAQSSQIPMKVLGNDLLKRFNVIFDFQKNEMYLKINHLRDTPFAIKK